MELPGGHYPIWSGELRWKKAILTGRRCGTQYTSRKRLIRIIHKLYYGHATHRCIGFATAEPYTKIHVCRCGYTWLRLQLKKQEN